MSSLSPADADLLREILAWSEVHDPEGARFSPRPFQDMLTKGRPLTPKQKLWAKRIIATLTDTPQYENAWSSGSVPRGREVETPEVLQHLPKSPPGRRVAE
jgi:hypothetical protein